MLHLANRKQALSLTADKDFGELVFRQRRLATGVVLLRLAGLAADRKASLVARALAEHSHRLVGTASTQRNPGNYRENRSSDSRLGWEISPPERCSLSRDGFSLCGLCDLCGDIRAQCSGMAPATCDTEFGPNEQRHKSGDVRHTSRRRHVARTEGDLAPTSGSFTLTRGPGLRYARSRSIGASAPETDIPIGWRSIRSAATED